MSDSRAASIRDAAQFLEYAAVKLLAVDAVSTAGDQRARKLLSHVQSCAEVARGLAEAVGREKVPPCVAEDPHRPVCKCGHGPWLHIGNPSLTGAVGCLGNECACRRFEPVPPERNQCDGCARGLPIVNGLHREPDGHPVQGCIAPLARHCPDCGGTGRRGADEQCQACGGAGQVEEAEHYEKARRNGMPASRRHG